MSGSPIPSNKQSLIIDRMFESHTNIVLYISLCGSMQFISTSTKFIIAAPHRELPQVIKKEQKQMINNSTSFIYKKH